MLGQVVEQRLQRHALEEYYHRDERVPRFRTLPDSRLVHVRDLYTEEEKRTSAAYNEALALSDTGNSVSARMDGPHGSRIVWSFADPVDARGWSCERIDLIERLLPHLRQYVRVRQALADVGGLSASFPALLDLRGTGVIQLDRRGWIVTANDRASDVLKACDALFDRDRALCARVPEDNDKLRSLLARALPPSPARGASGSMVVRRPFGLLPLVLHIVPVGDGEAVAAHVGALVLVVDPLARPCAAASSQATHIGRFGGPRTRGHSISARICAWGHCVRSRGESRRANSPIDHGFASA